MYELQKLKQVEGTLDIDVGAWDVRCEDRTYPDICSLPELRLVLLTFRMGNQEENKPKWAHIYRYQVNSRSQADLSSHQECHYNSKILEQVNDKKLGIG